MLRGPPQSSSSFTRGCSEPLASQRSAGRGVAAILLEKPVGRALAAREEASGGGLGLREERRGSDLRAWPRSDD